MRQAYQTSLVQLEVESSRMCLVARNCLQDATRALLDADLGLAEQACSAAAVMPRLRIAAESRALGMLALQAPVASDLRVVLSSLWNVADLERMGALAGDVAHTAARRHPYPVVPDSVRPIIERMAELGVRAADEAGEVLRSRDVGLAQSMEARDSLMDDAQRVVFSTLLAPTWSHGAAAAVDIALLGRCFERFADHAVAVARRIVFLVTGTRPTPSKRGPPLPHCRFVPMP
jgi:phosphate transport system protein